ncbi:uncharacterized protein LOC112450404 isoform X2 [Kryptolebias marmoratus]|uniref:uncharacterized protein LOC112450404 isoform X2 n=1 Tax=Kryptolebias marmoratus TaxID=37003 RepID=UPI0018ACC8B6|nr:uncharacterized protein LOC112450404 isoform X2 [Kryptolebias marmoratus]
MSQLKKPAFLFSQTLSLQDSDSEESSSLSSSSDSSNEVEVHISLYRIRVGITYLVLIISQKWYEQLEMEVKELMQKLQREGMREESAQESQSAQGDNDKSEDETTISASKEDRLGEMKAHLKKIIQEAEYNLKMMIWHFVTIDPQQINSDDHEVVDDKLLLMEDKELLQQLCCKGLREESTQKDQIAQGDHDNFETETTNRSTEDRQGELRKNFERLLQDTEDDTNTLREEAEVAQRELTSSMNRCSELTRRVEELMKQLQSKEMSEVSAEEDRCAQKDQSAQKGCDNEGEEQPLSEESIYLQDKLIDENFELQGDQQDFFPCEEVTTPFQSLRDSLATSDPDNMQYERLLECPVCQIMCPCSLYRQLADHLEDCILDSHFNTMMGI